jgi:trans-aconitate 2-methyltransferase
MSYTSSSIEQFSKIKRGNFVMLPKYIPFYSERSLPQRNWALDLIEKHNFDGMSRIIDLGCRDGYVTMVLAKNHPKAQIIGLDNSTKLLETANENLARESIQNLEFSFIDVLTYHAPHSSDAVFSVGYIHWVQDKLSTLKEIKNSLKPGGKVFLSFFADHQRKRFDACIQAITQLDHWKNYFVNYHRVLKEIKAYEFASLVYKSGLLLQRLEFIEIHDIFTSKLQFMDWFTTWCDCLRHLPEELHYVFLSEVADKHLEAYPPDSKGQVHRYDYMLEVDLLKDEHA